MVDHSRIRVYFCIIYQLPELDIRNFTGPGGGVNILENIRFSTESVSARSPLLEVGNRLAFLRLRLKDFGTLGVQLNGAIMSDHSWDSQWATMKPSDIFRRMI